VKNKAKMDGPYVSVVAATINQENHAAATVVEKIRCVLNMIAPRYTILPHPIVVPPTIGRVSHASGEVIHPKVDDRVEIIDDSMRTPNPPLRGAEIFYVHSRTASNVDPSTALGAVARREICQAGGSYRFWRSRWQLLARSSSPRLLDPIVNRWFL